VALDRVVGERFEDPTVNELRSSNPDREDEYVVGRGTSAAKRAMDISLSLVLIVLASPLMLFVALAIKIDSRGPILFRCLRVGAGGRTFLMLKFRKMRTGVHGPALTIDDDARFTRVGRFLAYTKLDELPQLWNVLRGQMSLVGPRPEDPRFVAVLPDEYAVILKVRPGLTGYTQLAMFEEAAILNPQDPEAHYTSDLLPKKAVLDLLYVRKLSVRRDIQILLWTATRTLTRRSVAVHRSSGAINFRYRPTVTSALVHEQAPS
jgi:lipopolysaccharide/colanic/teichoic acid biosynthesis glycosyltransferase